MSGKFRRQQKTRMNGEERVRARVGVRWTVDHGEVRTRSVGAVQFLEVKWEQTPGFQPEEVHSLTFKVLPLDGSSEIKLETGIKKKE